LLAYPGLIKTYDQGRIEATPIGVASPFGGPFMLNNLLCLKKDKIFVLVFRRH